MFHIINRNKSAAYSPVSVAIPTNRPPISMIVPTNMGIYYISGECGCI